MLCGLGNGCLTALWTLRLPTLLSGRLAISNANIRVNIKEKVEGTNTIYDIDHMDKQDHICFHLSVHLIKGGNTKVDVEGLDTCCCPASQCAGVG